MHQFPSSKPFRPPPRSFQSERHSARRSGCTGQRQRPYSSPRSGQRETKQRWYRLKPYIICSSAPRWYWLNMKQLTGCNGTDLIPPCHKAGVKSHFVWPWPQKRSFLECHPDWCLIMSASGPTKWEFQGDQWPQLVGYRWRIVNLEPTKKRCPKPNSTPPLLETADRDLFRPRTSSKQSSATVFASLGVTGVIWKASWALVRNSTHQRICTGLHIPTGCRLFAFVANELRKAYWTNNPEWMAEDVETFWGTFYQNSSKSPIIEAESLQLTPVAHVCCHSW